MAIMGAGKSGLSALKLAQKLNYQVTLINQGEVSTWKPLDLDLDIKCVAQEDCVDVLKASDIIVKSPGIDPRQELFKEVSSSKIISEVEFAFRHFNQKAKIIAITGSNGKTTTATMIAQYLQRIGKKVFLGGNIGTPVCEFVLNNPPVDYVVLELSSFQLENMQDFKADLGIILNIMENHMERYDSVKDYAFAKYNLYKHCNHLLVNSDSRYFQNAQHVETFSSAQKYTGEILLPGEHNRQNAYVVQRSIEILKEDKSQLAEFFQTFGGVEHRLEFVGDFNGLKVYNDSKSTNMIALNAALSDLKNNEDNYLILTGKPRGGENINQILLENKENLKTVYSYGAVNMILEGSVIKKNNLAEIIDEVKNKTGILIFSPGFPSYDLYPNFEVRGREFKRIINEMLSQ